MRPPGNSQAMSSRGRVAPLTKVSCVLPWTFPGRPLIGGISLDADTVCCVARQRETVSGSLLLNVLPGLGAVSQDDAMVFLCV